ncbi:pyridoxal phosphate-dependent aminotransferase [Thermoactinomyces sp. DSM 45892]|uniref:pyridoxal phosphate-dependent aminotransferase n=1 Tax=Thermoactinomyces sp. DSM 45892 TaxID=1882753 RepID=UPI000897322A|nr:pyridoxal phosphate-dependent aminotransferase [Thermoactinomyces sp. DSM 45892]SDZ04168.1 aminotransferase [Thermoactinomyces sp. DSM 45892]
MAQFAQADVLTKLPKQFFANLVQKVNHLIASGADVINLGQGNPDLPTPHHIVQAMQEATAKSEHHRYPPFRGHRFLKEAVAHFYAREYGVELNPDREVAVLFGGKVGLVEISQCYLNPNDIALVPDPGYPDYWSGIAMARAKMVQMPLLEKNQFLPDFTQISDEVWNQAKCMFLNYPNNPTAGIATTEFFEETVARARDYRVLVVHDFAYGAIGFDGQKPISFMQIPGSKEVGIEVYTLSKTYNMAGWRIAFAVGNEQVIESIQLIQDHFYVSIFGAIQEAAAVALNHSQECVDELVGVYESRRNAFISRIQELGVEDIHAPKGSFFCWLPTPSGLRSQEFADLLLEQEHVAVAPGVGFGESGDGYIRVGLLTTEERLIEAAERMARCYHQLKID